MNHERRFVLKTSETPADETLRHGKERFAEVFLSVDVSEPAA